jgi:hypothetical protein
VNDAIDVIDEIVAIDVMVTGACEARAATPGQ